MLITISNIIEPDQLLQCREALEQAQWVDGRNTAGHIAANVKNNLQLPLDNPIGRDIGQFFLHALNRHPEFVAAALPLRILPPRFNRYEDGQEYGFHIDNAIFGMPDTNERIRTDIATTIFLSDPDDYDGGELVIQDTYGTHSVKLPAGHAVIYPGTSLHRVAPVTRGTRLAAFFWTQSLIRHDHHRSILWELDNAVQDLAQNDPDGQALARLSGIYHNLLREWSET